MNSVSFFMVNTKTKIRIKVIPNVSHEIILQQTFMRHCISFVSKRKMYLAIPVKCKQRILTWQLGAPRFTKVLKKSGVKYDRLLSNQTHIKPAESVCGLIHQSYLQGGTLFRPDRTKWGKVLYLLNLWHTVLLSEGKILEKSIFTA